jgi:hypothetical protein
MKRILRLLLPALFALPLFAVITTDPLAPVAGEAIEVRFQVTCGLDKATVSRDGSVIRIEYEDLGAICSPPVATIASVSIGALSAGQYDVQVAPKGRELTGLATLVVRHVTPLLEAHPFVVGANDDAPYIRVRVHRPDGRAVCGKSDCSDVRLRVGGVEVALTSTNDGGAWFIPPSHDAGLVDIELVKGDVVEVATAALFYAPPRPVPSTVERVLFPVLDSVSGAHGSNWISEVVLANPNPWTVYDIGQIHPIRCAILPCFTRLQPGSIMAFEGRSFPRGVALLLPRGESERLSFSLRVRDTSRVSEGFGTRVPVVRERHMLRNHPVTLLDVPREPKYRVKVRFYALAPFFEEVPVGTLTIVDQATGARTQQQVTFARAEDDVDERQPAFAELDLPTGAAGQRVSLYLQPPAESLAWGFASVTNNETQQVTIVTPDGEGGVPCAGCREP